MIAETLGADPADVITRALQAVGPGVGPLPAKEDKRTATLRRRLERTQQDIAALLASLDNVRETP